MMGGVWALFDRAETVVNSRTKRSITNWLRRLDLSVGESWANSFNHLFIGVFGERHFSLRCFLSSCLASCAFLILFCGIWFVSDFESASATFSPFTVSAVAILLIGGIVNFLPDYLSLWQTRMFLKLMTRSSSKITVLLLLVVDAFLTWFIFFAFITLLAVIYLLIYLDSTTQSIPLGGTLSTLIDTTIEAITMKTVGDTKVSLGPFFYTSFITSMWLWLYVLSGVFVRMIKSSNRVLSRLLSVLDLKEKPIRSLGFISMMMVTAIYLVAPVIGWIVGGEYM